MWAAFLTTRPGSSFVAGTLTATAAFAGAHFSLRGAAAGLAMTTLTRFGFVVNDLFDYSKDRAAGVQRPLAAGKLSMKGAVWTAITTLACSSITCALAGAGPRLVATVALLLVLYSPLARRYALCKDIYVAFLCCVPLYYGGLIGGQRYSCFAYVSLACFVFGREVLMDSYELAGDLKSGLKTIAAVLGQHESMYLGVALMIVASGASALVLHGQIAMATCFSAPAFLTGVFGWPNLTEGTRISLSRVPMLLGSMALACGGFARHG
jgi:geranylgeranylglycerol-phosphate geranylgeranyltransferase